MQRHLGPALLAAALTGCVTGAEPMQAIEVRVPVPVPCIAAIPERPVLDSPQAWASGASDYDKTVALLIDHGRLVAHVDALEAAMAPCVRREM